jgi:hypothetical protein
VLCFLSVFPPKPCVHSSFSSMRAAFTTHLLFVLIWLEAKVMKFLMMMCETVETKRSPASIQYLLMSTNICVNLFSECFKCIRFVSSARLYRKQRDACQGGYVSDDRTKLILLLICKFIWCSLKQCKDYYGWRVVTNVGRSDRGEF